MLLIVALVVAARAPSQPQNVGTVCMFFWASCWDTDVTACTCWSRVRDCCCWWFSIVHLERLFYAVFDFWCAINAYIYAKPYFYILANIQNREADEIGAFRFFGVTCLALCIGPGTVPSMVPIYTKCQHFHPEEFTERTCCLFACIYAHSFAGWIDDHKAICIERVFCGGTWKIDLTLLLRCLLSREIRQL